MTKFCALRAKTYSFLLDDDTEKKETRVRKNA